ncbi:hypothetical protein MKX01_027929 [Papaver californicum]|nr:hypothetical protein MKX01_027929 [Papaver californicum]
MGKLYVETVPPTDLNKNTEWFMYPGVWITYILIVFVTYQFFHWKKGTTFAEDQGIYNGLTWWEQIDKGKQLTRNRKFLTCLPSRDCGNIPRSQVVCFSRFANFYRFFLFSHV